MVQPNTKIGADGRRHPAGDEPTNAADFRRKPVSVVGTLEAGQTAVWDPDLGRFVPADAGLSDDQIAALATDQELADAIAGAGGKVTIEADNVEVAPDVTTLNFVGATVTDAGYGQANIEFSGGGAEVVAFEGGGTEQAVSIPGDLIFGSVWARAATATARIAAQDPDYPDRDTPGNMAFGEVVAWGAGTGLIQTGYEGGSMAFGYAYGNDDHNGTIYAKDAGGFAAGYSRGGQIYAKEKGNFAHGYANNGASIYTRYEGGFAQGMAKAGYSFIPAAGTVRIASNKQGSAAFGYVRTGYNAAISKIQTGGEGAFAMGYARGGGVANADAMIYSNGKGSFAGGHARAEGVAGDNMVYADGKGALAFGHVGGYSASGGMIGAFGNGGIAMGEAYDGGHVESWEGGAFACGRAQGDGSTIQAEAYGAIAMGRAENGFDIRASQSGAFAVGLATAALVHANAVSAMQVGEGVNAQATSIAAGGGVRINGLVPVGPRNGDIWVDGAGNVMIRSNGVNKNISNIT